MLIESLDILRCPICRDDFYFDEVGTGCATAGTLRCGAGHAFDFARQGYVNLVPGGKLIHTADDADMVAARARYHDKDHNRGLADRVAELTLDRIRAQMADEAADASTETASGDSAHYYVVDVGAGTGYYAGAVAEAAEADPTLSGRVSILAFDISKYALRRAAKAHPNVVAMGVDTWDGLPLADRSVDVLYCVFAPRNAQEFKRVLKPNGRLIVVRPTQDHMVEIRDQAGLIKIGGNKEQDLERKLAPYFETVEQETYGQPLVLSHRDVEDLVMMGPNRHHTTVEKLREAIAELPDPATTTMKVEVTAYRRRG